MKTNIVSQLSKNVPDDFPHFTFAGHPEQAQLLSHFLWHHFHHRLGNSTVLFNKEYLLTADIWLGNAYPRGLQEKVQEVHRRALLEMYLDNEGYVSSHQHFSQAHDLGWPFPSWGQAHKDLTQVKGKATGWHFQPLKSVPGWIGEDLRTWNGKEYTGETAVSLWELYNVKSLGMENNCWRLQATGPSPTIATPPGYCINAFDSPYLQLRWKRSDASRNHTAPYIEWLSEEDGRFVACIDKNGKKHDYGYTFLNLDAIWYDLASRDHARQIMDWIAGKRIVQGDTSTGADIYRWRFGPRATTCRNIEWYGQGWWAPESLDWGYQIQDGGAVLGFTFYDLWARLQILGPDNAWQRLMEILASEKEVHSEGGYREYYQGGKRGTTLQGGGTCGGLGIDYEFFESSLLPSIIPYGFLGLNARPDGYVAINPRLPKACPEMAISNILYRGVRFDIRVTNDTIELDCKKLPPDPIHIVLEGTWQQAKSDWLGSVCVLNQAGLYSLTRCK